jgi:hypothetical protein
MGTGKASFCMTVAALAQRALPHPYPRFSLAELKARQSAKMRELREALATAGFTTLNEQARALGLSRSTAWTILNGNHKSSGLSPAIVNRMLLAPRLPSLARAKILEYVEERKAGHYGHSNLAIHKFTCSLLIMPRNAPEIGSEQSVSP